MYCGCPAGTHGCDPVSRVRLDQNANPVVVWLGLVSRVREVIVETWNMSESQHFCEENLDKLKTRCSLSRLDVACLESRKEL